MPARIESAPVLSKSSEFRLSMAFFLAVLFFFAANSPAQTVAHSPGWVVLPVEEYRTLHARAFQLEHRDRVRDLVSGDYREVMIEGAGHWLQQERPAEVNETLLDFLARLELR